MPTSEPQNHTTAAGLESFRRAKRLRDRCRESAVAAGQRIGEPVSPVQANVAFDAMVDLIREHDQADVQQAPNVSVLEAYSHTAGWDEPALAAFAAYVASASPELVMRFVSEMPSSQARTASRPYLTTSDHPGEPCNEACDERGGANRG